MKMVRSSEKMFVSRTVVFAFAISVVAFCFFSLRSSASAQEPGKQIFHEKEFDVSAENVEALPTFSFGLNSQLFPYAERARGNKTWSSERSPEAFDPTAVYANATGFTGYIIFNGGQVNGITRLVADNLSLVGTPPHNIGRIFYVFCNGNPGTVSLRPKIRYYLDSGGTPGTFLAGFNFPAASVPTSSCAPFISRRPLAQQFTVTSNAMWAAMTFDNASGATATNAQMDLIGMAFYNPPDLGSSNDNFFLSSGTPGEFNANSPTGGITSFVSSPPPDPPDNFGFELRKRVKIAPIVRNGSTSQPASSTISWTVTLDMADGGDGNQLTGLTTANFALGTGGAATGTISSVVPNGSANNSWTVSANAGAGTGYLTLNLVSDSGLNTGLANTLPVAGGTYSIGGAAITVGGPGIVIAQVYGGGGATSGTPTYTKDYVELKNTSSSPKSLNGYSIYYGSATGQFASSAGNAFALPNVMLQPGRSFLVTAGTVGTVGATIPVTADADAATLNMAAGSGKVALVAGLPTNLCGATATPCALPNYQIVDIASYGASNNGEGGTTINNGIAITNAQGGVRKNSECQDTDNNNNDFDVVSAPVPRNSSSPILLCGFPTNTRTPNDYDGDGRTDYVVLRDSNGASPGGFVDWYIQMNSNAWMYQIQWGNYDPNTEDLAAADYDGDGKTDVAVYRRGATLSTFYIILSATNTLWTDQLGLTADDPRPGDYNGDGRADLAVDRNNGNGTSSWFYRPNFFSDYQTLNLSASGSGLPGDYDGDGVTDPATFHPNGGNGQFTVRLSSTGGTSNIDLGTSTDMAAPGDYDGDGKTDACVIQNVGGFWQWTYKRSIDGVNVVDTWGIAPTDMPTPGDYNGDGKWDYGVWRPTAQGEFLIMTPGSRMIFGRLWGLNGDFPLANATNVGNN
jgi:hypothetical protein